MRPKNNRGWANVSEKKATYRLYVDESGDHAYSLLDNPEHRYLALLGVWFRQQDEYVRFARNLEDFKNRIFGFRPDEPVILHRSEVVNCKGPFGRLKNSTVLEQFNNGLLDVARSAEFRIIVVVIDKKRHKEQYSTPFHPYHYCLHALLERYSGYLEFKNAS